jgi:hypothetical protein
VNLGALPQLECWSNGVMGELVLNKVKERNKETVFSAFTTNYSSTPPFHYSMCEAIDNSSDKELLFQLVVEIPKRFGSQQTQQIQ